MAKLHRMRRTKEQQAPTRLAAVRNVTGVTGVTEVPAQRPRVDPDLIVLGALAEQLDLSPGQVTGGEHLLIDLGVDDAQLPRLLTAMGDALDVRFPDDFFDGVHTIAQLTAAVRVSLSPL